LVYFERERRTADNDPGIGIDDAVYFFDRVFDFFSFCLKHGFIFTK